MSASSWVHLDVDEILRETDKAFLVRLESGREEWLPFSQIGDAEAYAVGDEGCTISITEWFANQKDLEGE